MTPADLSLDHALWVVSIGFAAWILLTWLAERWPWLKGNNREQ